TAAPRALPRMQSNTGFATAPPTAPAAPSIAAAPAAPPFVRRSSIIGGGGGGAIGRCVAGVAIPGKRSASAAPCWAGTALGSWTGSPGWQLGQLTRLPTADAGTFRDFPQESQANLMGSAAAGGAAAGSPGSGAEVAGISTALPHLGHLPRLPALAAGTRMRA